MEISALEDKEVPGHLGFCLVGFKMLNKLELRFNHWRGEKAAAEKQYLDSALLLENYLKPINSIQTIKNDLKSKDSSLFKTISKFEFYIFSTLLFAKLEIEELLETYCNQSLQNPILIERKQLMLETIEILGQLYSSPATNQLNNLNKLIKNIQNLTSKEIENKTEDQTLCFVLYIMFRIITIWFEELNSFKLSVLSVGINVSEIRQQIETLMKQTEKKSMNLALLLKSGNHQLFDEQLTNDLLKIVKKKTNASIKLSLLTNHLNQVQANTNLLIDLKEQQNQTIDEMNRVNDLYFLILDNEKKLFKQDYFIQLIQEHRETFEQVLQQASGTKKEQIYANLKRIQEDNESKFSYTTLVKGISYTTIIPSAIWRSVAPSAAQNLINKMIPYTLDSQSTAYFKELALMHVAKLSEKLQRINSRINEMTTQMASQNEGIKKSLELKTIDDLKTLKQASSSAHKTVLAFTDVSDKIQNHIAVLDQFLAHHNNFLVKLSIFFAKISRFFKSDTAKLVERALQVKNKLLEFEQSCLQELAFLENPNSPFDKYREMSYKYQRFCRKDPSYIRTLNNITLLEYTYVLENNMNEFKSPKHFLRENSNPPPLESKSDLTAQEKAAIIPLNPQPSSLTSLSKSLSFNQF